jgi:hypothetical protein
VRLYSTGKDKNFEREVSSGEMVMDDFIWVDEDAVEQEVCEKIIERFDDYNDSGLVFSRQKAERVTRMGKDDVAIGYSYAFNFQFNDNIGLIVNKEIMQSFYDYCDRYQTLVDVDLCIKHFKIQKTLPGGGYHLWHFEQMDAPAADRIVVFSLYLNDIDDGGETEFLYQQRRVKPKQGSIAWWPASYTHTHRGNPPLGDTSKYIVTGWVELQSR